MKLEDNIKQKLEARRIEPTASAWDRIEGKLDAEQGKKKSKVLLWVGIAASFVAGVFLTALLYSSDSEGVSNEVVSTQDTIENTQEVETTFEVQENSETTQVAEVTDEVEKTDADKKTDGTLSRKRTPNKERPIKNIDTPNIQNSKNVETAVATTKKKEAVVVEIEKPLSTNSFKNAGLSEAVASSEGTVVTDEEIDALLKNAQLEIKKKSSTTSRTAVVDANELLLDVESEVDPDSFKDKVFSTLKKEINKAVEAVANKDN